MYRTNQTDVWYEFRGAAKKKIQLCPACLQKSTMQLGGIILNYFAQLGVPSLPLLVHLINNNKYLLVSVLKRVM